ncbi:BolA/IbaG family iron-sulfur metabolism protein [Sulfurivirga sp.]|uniref:BolA family protein n=1 Tax=Sulfurivirga sp. TaxID=2614236 RepID=UPI0025FB2E0A|nr:BolA/IbaG family iron-sulfur metabolism protein [Sulfurivirga sp.]
MAPETVKKIITDALPDAKVQVSGEECSFTVEVESAAFAGKTPLQRHRMINDLFKSQLESGELHALSIKTRVPAE